jgi:hypothetical protein
MAYDYRVLTPQFVLNRFLYGGDTTPSSMVDDKLIRTADFKSLLFIEAASFMTSGPGRFVNPSMSTLVQNFFSSTSAALFSDGQRHEYSIADMIGLVGGSQLISIQQYNYDDGSGDLAARTLIWGSSPFILGGNTKFIVDANGNRTIDNLAVWPLDDNFDFSSNNPLTILFESTLQSWMDPSSLGRKIDFNFFNVGSVPSKNGYSESDLTNDLIRQNQFYSPINLSIGGALYNAVSAIADDLWNSGTTRFLDSDNRPIIYGTQAGVIVQQESISDDQIVDALVAFVDRVVVQALRRS